MKYQKSFIRAQQMHDVPKTSSKIVKSDPPPPPPQEPPQEEVTTFDLPMTESIVNSESTKSIDDTFSPTTGSIVSKTIAKNK